MIPVMNSKELNNIFQKAQDKNIKFEQELQAIKRSIWIIDKANRFFISQ